MDNPGLIDAEHDKNPNGDDPLPADRNLRAPGAR
jgi:hypothetical protein